MKLAIMMTYAFLGLLLLLFLMGSILNAIRHSDYEEAVATPRPDEPKPEPDVH
ncbi:hypothetical protein [Brevibacillus dissolubilis]|uniref:hypothetical protein n=1 Tax=Brevibacillus dissolubilis TaxID=1844116 RepID=UPI00159B9BCA|nr:hypothetical protein [Brevibacillus dissolubilis]